MAVEALLLKVLSPTGALVADYWNNTEKNDGLSFKLKTEKIGGLIEWTVKMKNSIEEPLFTGSQFQFWVDGVHWFSGFVDHIPDIDTDAAEIEITGVGYWKKLTTVVVNESYSSQTLAYIVDDVCTTYLTDDLQVTYDALKVSVPTVTGVTMEFNDQSLDAVLQELLGVANASYETAQYRIGVDKERDFIFELIDSDPIAAFSEGYDYQHPDVDDSESKLINTILAYKASAVSSSTVGYVDTFTDVDSVGDYGEHAEKVTFPSFIDDTTVEAVCDGIIEKYAHPLTRVKIKDLKIDDVFNFGFYTAINKRQRYYRPVTKFNDLTDWDVTAAPDTTITISDEQVYAGRRAMKVVTGTGSSDDYIVTYPDNAVRSPQMFNLYVYLATAGAKFTIKVSDSFGNIANIPIGYSNEPINEWLKYEVDIEIRYETAIMEVDSPTATGDTEDFEVDSPTATGDENDFELRALTNVGILNLYKIEITMDVDIATTAYFDAFNVEASSYKPHTLVLEEAEYNLGKSRLLDLVLGNQSDSIIKEINSETAAGRAALNVFAKQ